MSAMFSVKEDYEVDEAGRPALSGAWWHSMSEAPPCLDCWTAPTPDCYRENTPGWGYAGLHLHFLRPVGSPGCPHGRAER